MKFFLDSAKIDEIRYAREMWAIDGVTSNPRHIKTSGKPFLAAVEDLAALGREFGEDFAEHSNGGVEVRLVESGLESFIKRNDLSRDRDEQRPERFSVGQKLDARVIAYDKKTRKVQVSIKALEIAEEKEAVAQYGSTDSGASLGDILGAALKGRNS